jgi:hypothetical protein
VISTLLPRTATGLSTVETCIAMERQSITAPGFGSAHGTGLPVAAVMTVNGTDARKARTALGSAVQAYVPGSPPRGGPV